MPASSSPCPPGHRQRLQSTHQHAVPAGPSAVAAEPAPSVTRSKARESRPAQDLSPQGPVKAEGTILGARPPTCEPTAGVGAGPYCSYAVRDVVDHTSNGDILFTVRCCCARRAPPPTPPRLMIPLVEINARRMSTNQSIHHEQTCLPNRWTCATARGHIWRRESLTNRVSFRGPFVGNAAANAPARWSL